MPRPYIARHVIGYRLYQERRVLSIIDDVAYIIYLALPLGVLSRATLIGSLEKLDAEAVKKAVTQYNEARPHP